MAGVKKVSIGFSEECFGLLYLHANSIGARIKFDSVDAKIKPILLSGIQASLKFK